jgi:hypothetical protein
MVVPKATSSVAVVACADAAPTAGRRCQSGEMVGLPAGRGEHRMGLRAATVALGVLAGCASNRATPAPTTPLPSLAPIVVAVTATTTITTAVVPQPAAPPAQLTDVYGVPLDTGVTYTVPPPATTAPHPPPPSPTSAPPVDNTAPPTTDCPHKKHRRRCKP